MLIWWWVDQKALSSILKTRALWQTPPLQKESARRTRSVQLTLALEPHPLLLTLTMMGILIWWWVKTTVIFIISRIRALWQTLPLQKEQAQETRSILLYLTLVLTALPPLSSTSTTTGILILWSVNSMEISTILKTRATLPMRISQKEPAQQIPSIILSLILSHPLLLTSITTGTMTWWWVKDLVVSSISKTRALWQFPPL